MLELTRPAKAGHQHSLNLLALLRQVDTIMLTHSKTPLFPIHQLLTGLGLPLGTQVLQNK